VEPIATVVSKKRSPLRFVAPHNSVCGPSSLFSALGRARQLCPGTSDFDFFSNLNGIVNLDAKIANGALDLRVAQQELDRTQVAGSSMDQRGFGPAQGVRAKLQRVKADASDPLTDETGVLARGEATIIAPAAEQELARLPASRSEVFIDRLPRLIGNFESDRSASLLLADCSSVQGVAVRSHVIDAHRDDITAPKFAIDREVEQREVTGSPRDLKLRPDRPDVARP
jgi:hypothetical protein